MPAVPKSGALVGERNPRRLGTASSTSVVRSGSAVVNLVRDQTRVLEKDETKKSSASSPLSCCTAEAEAVLRPPGYFQSRPMNDIFYLFYAFVLPDLLVLFEKR